ncbi:MAG TPA: methyltransferase domain-containing protein [Polyangiaceae bacterium]|nr:methyltransferase domain-containing protein [Polyangiaceae bacterium]
MRSFSDADAYTHALTTENELVAAEQRNAGSPAARTLLPSGASVRQALGAGALSDPDFDRLYPEKIQVASWRFWTPIHVAYRAAEVLESLGAARVLDVGSGPGKFCIIGGMVAPNVTFVGVEHRGHLVATAREVASRLDVSNVHFAVGDATAAALNRFDAYYLYNPFGENLFQREDWLDADVELSFRRYVHDRHRMRAALAQARVGTIVITYHGPGMTMPSGYERLFADPIGSDSLCVWQKKRAGATAGSHPLRGKS